MHGTNRERLYTKYHDALKVARVAVGLILDEHIVVRHVFVAANPGFGPGVRGDGLAMQVHEPRRWRCREVHAGDKRLAAISVPGAVSGPETPASEVDFDHPALDRLHGHVA